MLLHVVNHPQGNALHFFQLLCQLLVLQLPDDAVQSVEVADCFLVAVLVKICDRLCRIAFQGGVFDVLQLLFFSLLFLVAGIPEATGADGCHGETQQKDDAASYQLTGEEASQAQQHGEGAGDGQGGMCHDR